MNKKYRERLYISILLVASAIFCYSSYAFAAASGQFSADMISRSGRQTNKAKLYLSGEKTRSEMEGNIIITRLDKNICWIVMPSEHMYMEQAINRKMIPKTSGQMEGEVERASLGKEIIDGKQVEKFKVTYMENNRRVAMYQWVMNSGFPVKMEAVDGSWSVEYKNIVFGAQPDSLFELPAGFQKASMPFSGGSGMPSLADLIQEKAEDR